MEEKQQDNVIDSIMLDAETNSNAKDNFLFYKIFGVSNELSNNIIEILYEINKLAVNKYQIYSNELKGRNTNNNNLYYLIVVDKNIKKK